MSETQIQGWRVNPWRQQAGGLSRGFVYKLIHQGLIETTKIGKARVILTPPREFLDKCRREQGEDEC